MPASPLVSIVMPSFNQDRFIAESVRSVLSQSHESIELIVMDGNSTDGTLDTLARLQAEDARLRWFSQPDTGPAQALNRALAKVRGTIIGWLNSDDLYTDGAIARTVKALQEHPEWLMVYGHGQHVDAQGKFLSDYPTRPPSAPAGDFASGCFICQPTVFFRRTMHVLLGPLDEKLRTAFDFDYWLRAFNRLSGRIGFVDQVQALSRLHDDCITLNQRRRVSLESMRLISKHLGQAPAHWLLSHIDEARDPDGNPLAGSTARQYIDALLQDCAAFVPADDLPGLRRKLEGRAGIKPDIPSPPAPASAALAPIRKPPADTWLPLSDLILMLRSDLREGQHFGEPARWADYLFWLLHNGRAEYPGLDQDTEFLEAMRAPAEQMPVLTRLQYLIWQARPDLQQACPLPSAFDRFVQWFFERGVTEYALWPLLAPTDYRRARRHAMSQPARSDRPIPDLAPAPVQPDLPFGVNLVGHVFSRLGVGEDARMAAKALQAAGIPFTLIDFPPGPGISQDDRSMEALVGTDMPYAINLFCMTAEEQARWHAINGRHSLQGRRNIGYWPWELSRWPQAWQPVCGLIQEAWVSSRHTLEALQPVARVPVHLMPMAVDLGPITKGGRQRTRTRFKLPAKAHLFCFSFDLNSSMARKNPQAALAAFLRAFPDQQDSRVRLVIKVLPPAQPHAEWDALKAEAAHDPRLHIIEASLDRPDLLALYQCCDTFVSLHRAEGFGRGLAEAMQLGLRVVTTGYSGNVDFCQGPGVALVRYKLIPVPEGDYAHARGQVWADPDIDDAARCMREALTAPPPDKAANQTRFSPAAIGALYRERLNALQETINSSSSITS